MLAWFRLACVVAWVWACCWLVACVRGGGGFDDAGGSATSPGKHQRPLVIEFGRLRLERTAVGATNKKGSSKKSRQNLIVPRPTRARHVQSGKLNQSSGRGSRRPPCRTLRGAAGQRRRCPGRGHVQSAFAGGERDEQSVGRRKGGKGVSRRWGVVRSMIDRKESVRLMDQRSG